MKVLLIGSGGREHAFAWKLSQSPLCEKLFIAPGNVGTSEHGTNVPIGANDFEALTQFAVEQGIDMLVVGPDDPLVNGICDYFKSKQELGDIRLIGPTKAGAMLEGSKAFSKQFMLRHGIPTAAYREFERANLQEGLAYIDGQNPPIVLKADGLALGKGVVISSSKEEAKAELSEMILNSKFSKSSDKVVIEQFLRGIEFSVFVLTDGVNYKILPNAKDYKRIGEGDTGLNTGGMGCISPVPFVNSALMQKVEERIIAPTITGLQKDNIEYKGFIYFGLMNVPSLIPEKITNASMLTAMDTANPYVIEYNCRMGDPETEVVFPRLKSDLLAHFVALSAGRLSDEVIEIDERAAATIVAASGGYPEKFETGKEISGIDLVGGDTIVFQAGTKNLNGKIVTSGGRVLAVTSFGTDLETALSRSKGATASIGFEGKYYRRDIGFEFE